MCCLYKAFVVNSPWSVEESPAFQGSVFWTVVAAFWQLVFLEVGRDFVVTIRRSLSRLNAGRRYTNDWLCGKYAFRVLLCIHSVEWFGSADLTELFRNSCLRFWTRPQTQRNMAVGVWLVPAVASFMHQHSNLVQNEGAVNPGVGHEDALICDEFVGRRWRVSLKTCFRKSWLSARFRLLGAFY